MSKSNVCCRSCYTVVKPGHSTRKRLSSYAPSSRDTCGRFWFDFVSNEEVLAKSDVVDIEVLLAQSRSRWLGHVSRMEDNRTCKQLLYGELADGSRPIGRPKLCFKDNCKSILKTGNILHNWNDTVKDRVKWRLMIKTVSDKLNISRKRKYERARERRKR